jgi:hypothetical protein
LIAEIEVKSGGRISQEGIWRRIMAAEDAGTMPSPIGAPDAENLDYETVPTPHYDAAEVYALFDDLMPQSAAAVPEPTPQPVKVAPEPAHLMNERKAGRRPTAAWNAARDALFIKLNESGYPDAENDNLNWRKQDDANRFVGEFLEARKQSVADKTIEGHVSKMLKAWKESHPRN